MSDTSSSQLRTRYRYTGLVGDWVGGDGVGVTTPSLLWLVSMSTLETDNFAFQMFYLFALFFVFFKTNLNQIVMYQANHYQV